MTYISIFSEKTDIAKTKILLNSIKSKSFLKISQSIPRWIPVFFITLFTMAAALIFYNKMNFNNLLVVGSVLFLLRDIGIIYFFRLGDKNSKSGSKILFYLTLLYAVLPMLFLSLGMDYGVQFFYPSNKSNFAGLLQLSLVAFLVFDKFKKLSNSDHRN